MSQNLNLQVVELFEFVRFSSSLCKSSYPVMCSAFRQSHKTFFDKSDLLFLCMMRPVSFDIQKQELEIEAAQVSECYTFSKNVYEMPVYFVESSFA